MAAPGRRSPFQRASRHQPSRGSAIGRGIQAGVEITRERDPAKAAEIEPRIAGTLKVLDVDARIDRQTTRLMHRRPDHLFDDAMIAATAWVHDLTVVTRNARDCEPFGVRLVNPFAPAKT
ncbi:PIN domain-containing protein [Methylobacterium sp. ID0610]|uniref:PIN domain-containing protein n=1 Tax=Methylobacterium carpenticola TaxID=3344827 RepID=UPI00367372C8